jgi:hypothetical protein
MPIAQIPLWVTITGSFGVGGFVGNLVSFWLTSRLQRQNWVKDNKKQEWRELIDALREALRVMMARHYENYADVDDMTPAEDVRYREEAIRKGYVALGDRIFIVKKVRDSGLSDKWAALNDEYEKVDASIPEGLNRFNSFVKQAHKFQDDLVQFSREDLGLD